MIGYIFVLIFGQVILHLTVIKWFGIDEKPSDGKMRVDGYSYKYILLLSVYAFLMNSGFVVVTTLDTPSYFWLCSLGWLPMIWKFGIVILLIVLRHNVFNDEVGDEPVENFYGSIRKCYVSYTELLFQYIGYTFGPLFILNFLLGSPPEWGVPINSRIAMIIIYIIINFPIVIPDKLSKWSGHDLRGEGNYIYGILVVIGVLGPIVMFFGYIFLFT
jgi:hypothetical protein